MRYLLLIYADEQGQTSELRQNCYQESRQLIQELKTQGVFRDAAPLQPVALATSVRLRDSKKMITDGPFAETHEQLGGFFMIDVPDLDDAIKIASQIPAARWGTIEIRPVKELSI